MGQAEEEPCPGSNWWRAAPHSLHFSWEELRPREQKRVFPRNAVGVAGVNYPWAKDKARPAHVYLLEPKLESSRAPIPLISLRKRGLWAKSKGIIRLWSDISVLNLMAQVFN